MHLELPLGLEYLEDIFFVWIARLADRPYMRVTSALSLPPVKGFGLNLNEDHTAYKPSESNSQ